MQQEPIVVNVHKADLAARGFRDFADWASRPDHLYIGRNMSFYVPGAIASKWANPFKIKSGTASAPAIAECLNRYENHIREHPDLWNAHSPVGRMNCFAISELDHIREIGCWCVPNPCHGQVLVRLWREYHAQHV